MVGGMGLADQLSPALITPRRVVMYRRYPASIAKGVVLRDTVVVLARKPIGKTIKQRAMGCDDRSL